MEGIALAEVLPFDVPFLDRLLADGVLTDGVSFVAFVLFVIVMVATPGPGNLLMMTGGAQFGVGRCMPFNAGLIGGKVGINLAMGMGIGLLLGGMPRVLLVMKFVSAAYMLWLALQSWSARSGGAVRRSQFTFAKGLLVHPLSPKTWVMCLLAWSHFAPALGSPAVQLVAVTGTFAAAQVIFHTSWCMAGQLLGRAIPNHLWLTRVLVLITVAVVLAALLV